MNADMTSRSRGRRPSDVAPTVTDVAQMVTNTLSLTAELLKLNPPDAFVRATVKSIQIALGELTPIVVSASKLPLTSEVTDQILIGSADHGHGGRFWAGE